MIIYGWGYFNRRQFNHTMRTCPHCGHIGHHRSYTATRYASLYFVPVIPIGTKRVMAECPKCKKALLIGSSHWNKQNDQLLPSKLTEWRSNRSNREFTEDLIQLTLALEHKEAFKEVAGYARKHFAGDPELLRMIARGYHCLMLPLEAQSTFLEAADTAGDQAMDIVQEAEQYSRQVKSKPITNPNRWLQSAPVMVVPTLILALGLWIITTLYIAGPRHVYAVNGLNEAYGITIEGKRISLPPMSRVKLSLPYGPVTIAHDPDTFPFDPISADLEVPHAERLDGKTVFLFNPDRTAFFIQQQLAYAVDPEEAQANSTIKPLVARSFYRLENIHHPFTKAPDEVNLPKHSSVVMRNSVYFEEEADPQSLVSWMYQSDFLTEASEYLKALISTGKQPIGLVYSLAALTPPEETIGFLRPLLDQTPVDVELHRAFQSIAESQWSDHKLRELYDGFLTRNPQESAFHYLRARLCLDRDETRRRIQQALTLNPDCAYSCYGSAWDALITANVEEANHKIDRAIEIDPENPVFQNFRSEVWMASGNWDALIADLLLDNGESPDDFQNASMLVQALVASEQPQEADRVVQQFLDYYPEIETTVREQLLNRFALTIASAAGNSKEIPAMLAKIDNTHLQIERHLLVKDLDSALDCWKELEFPDYYDDLPMLILIDTLAQSDGQNQVSLECQSLIESTIANLGERKRRIAALFNQPQSPSLDTVLSLPYNPADMRVLMCALGIHYPDARSVFFAHTRKLNYQPDSKKLLLDTLMQL